MEKVIAMLVVLRGLNIYTFASLIFGLIYGKYLASVYQRPRTVPAYRTRVFFIVRLYSCKFCFFSSSANPRRKQLMSHNHKNAGQEVPCSVSMSFYRYFSLFLCVFHYESEREAKEEKEMNF